MSSNPVSPAAPLHQRSELRATRWPEAVDSANRSRRVRWSRSFGFRLGLWFAFVFTVSAAALFGLLYWLLTQTIERRERQFLEARLAEYAALYEQRGLRALQAAVETESAQPGQTSLFVRLANHSNDVTLAR